MADIYTPEGTLDYAKAAAALIGTRTGTNPQKAMADLKHVEAAALLDIAVSLNQLLQVAAGGAGLYDEEDRDEEPPADESHEDVPAPLAVDDVIIIARDYDDEDDIDAAERFTITELGETEGRAWLSAVDQDGTPMHKAWADQFTRAPERDAGGFDFDDDAPNVFDELKQPEEEAALEEPAAEEPPVNDDGKLPRDHPKAPKTHGRTSAKSAMTACGRSINEVDDVSDLASQVTCKKCVRVLEAVA